MATSIKLDPLEHDRLRALAKARQRTPHYLMREAIREFLVREEAREAIRERARAAWSELDQARPTELVTDETREWLERIAEPMERHR
ncbi:CopG family ribbon-helix-helix protein [Dokdonella sp. MW10]|uniref:CopG family ribbon-helix-helix protein n=1 Tax=Dokdonella sp. MW10 TaxID=2992926 RepID=UPI003F80C36D